MLKKIIKRLQKFANTENNYYLCRRFLFLAMIECRGGDCIKAPSKLRTSLCWFR